LVLPQAVPVELRNVAERVVAAGMAIAGEAPKDGQTRQNAHARGCLERSRERRRVGDRLALEQAGESLARLFWSEHRLLLGGSGTIRTLGPTAILIVPNGPHFGQNNPQKSKDFERIKRTA